MMVKRPIDVFAWGHPQSRFIPGLFTAVHSPTRMAKELDQLLARDGFRSVTEAIGVDLESQ